MAEGRTFTEGEAYALVSDAVQRTTASWEGEKTSLQERLTAAETERDAAVAAQRAAEDAKAQVESEFQAFKDAQEAQKAAEAKRESRLAALKEAAPTLEISDERADRIVAMSDEAFDEMVASVRETAAAKGDPGKTPAASDTGVPRQSAALKGSGVGDDDKQRGGSVLAFLGAARSLRTGTES